MSDELIKRFKEYRLNGAITRVRMSAIPAELQPLARVYLDALTAQLADPENESWDSLGPNEHHNALQAVCIAFGPKPRPSSGNCPRCAGSGFIRAYSHIQGGKCLQCEGSGSVG